MNKKIILIHFAVFIILIPFGSAAHYVIGIVEDALDGTSANDFIITLWNPANGLSDNLTDIIGPNGNSGADNIYMINCHLLETKCKNGNNITVRVFNDGSGYLTQEVNVTIGGFGFTEAENLTLNSPPSVGTVTVEDFTVSPPNEIDLLPATTQLITCEGVVTEYDGEDAITNATALFFDMTNSNITALDNNNLHYSNNSCEVDYGYGTSNEVYVNCSLEIWYYANSGSWNCTLNVTDNVTGSGLGSDGTFINPLLAIGVEDWIQYGEFDARTVTDEVEMNVTNYGNVKINLSLNGYGHSDNDGNAMNCTLGTTKNISIEYERYNLTKSTPGNLDYNSFIGNYTNLTNHPVTKKFELDYRKNELFNDANKTSYWRMYVPEGIAGNCQGNVLFAAVQANED